ncbi:MAG: MBL fold metallo-hydrolase [Acidobacteria bacterium]|nr:MBL fold metallo-hydrolase [Acidobacteriota bacterium]
MTADRRPSRSFEADGSRTVTGANGIVAHEAHLGQSEVLARQLYTVRPGVWCLVGNGLSNQTFIDAPDGIIAIDTGESEQEMRAALAELRTVTDRPVAAVVYTHFHYVAGTTAVLEEPGHADPLPVHGHARIGANRARTGGEIAPAYGRGLVEQFAISLPDSGPDACDNVGLGFFFRDPAHAPFTPGHLPVTHPFDTACTVHVAGLEMQVHPAPSDADDSVTLWFPAIGTVVNNLVWPVLFNVFAIRGEEYRDPRVMLAGLDHLLSLHAEHLVGAHGPPISGSDTISDRVTRYRDSIQFLWDQTVRMTNRGLDSVELGHAIHLPDHCDDDHLTGEFYGVAEHHVRQIRSGLFGFFDGDPANLFPLPPADRTQRMIDGFGGREAVRVKAKAAIDGDDLRWGIELASWLERTAEDTLDGDGDRRLLASALRLVAQRTSAANIRSWCLTRALSLEGAIDMSRSRQHRLQPRNVAADPVAATHTLRVLLLPERAEGLDTVLAFDFGAGRTTALHLRNSVAVPLPGPVPAGAAATLRCDPAVWGDVLGGRIALTDALAAGSVAIDGDSAAASIALSAFDVKGLQT